MMSVYYYSLGSRLALQGAPAVLLPPAVRPMPLASALDLIGKQSDSHKRQALWTLLRSVPGPPQARERSALGKRYPAPVQKLAGEVGFGLDAFDRIRGYYRWQSLAFADALSAYAYGAPNATIMADGVASQAS